MISISTALTILCIFLFLVGIALHALIAPDLIDYKNMKEREEERSKVNLQHSGGGCLYFPPDWDKEKDGEHFNYHLKSWDGGKTWYAVEYDEDCVDGLWGLKILGLAEELYPGLIDHINGWDNLVEYVKEHGPISPEDTAGLLALKNAGFDVIKTEKDGK